MANKVNTIVGNDSNPTKLEAGQTIINKKATKQNLDKLIHINGGTSNPKTTTDGTDGGLLKGKPHYDSKGNPTGGIPAVVEGSNRVELEGDEFVVSKEASKKHWKELSKINQSAGNGVPINPPAGADEDIDTDEFERGGKIEFNPNKLPNKNILNYAIKIKEKYPKVWDLGGNIFGNEAFKNLKRVSERGYWLDSEEWMYKKWRAFVARHKGDFRIAGVIAMLKWVDSVDKGWAYMKELIEQEIAKKYPKNKMSKGGGMLLVPKGNIKFMEWYVGWYKKISDKINITFSLPNELLPFKEENVVILDLFEKIDQNIDAKPYLKEIVNQADKYGVTIYLEPIKRKKISKDYLIVYYQKFGFNLTFDGNFMKRLPKINPDISFAEGGGIKGTTSRIKPIETIVFDPPLEGVNGAKLVAYTWSYEWTMLPNWEGELVSKRVSDWTQAEESAETGRGIVHKFSVELPDKTTRVVSSESVPMLLGFTDRSQVKVFGNLATASKTLAKQQMKLAIMEAQQKEFNEAKQSIIDKGFPAPKVEKTDRLSGYILVVGDGSCFINEDGTYDQERLDCATDNYIKNRMKDLGFDVYRSNQSRQIYDLKNRVERQKRKVENLLKQDKMEDGGDIESATDYLLAPNGQPSNLTPKQYKLVRTPEFKAWFGDWENDPENASKVVDENGEPLVVYHGTTKEFYIFDNKEIGKNDYGYFGKGFYFGNLNASESYAQVLIWHEIHGTKNPNGRVLICFLNIRNPLVGSSENLMQSKETSSNFTNEVMKNYDGIVAVPYTRFSPNTEYVAFYPEQIKLADGTNTSFDSSNPDIRYDDGGNVEDLISKGIVELKMFDTKPEHAKEYGLDSKKPLYVQTICVSKNERLQGIGNKVLKYIDDYAVENGHDVVFGHITQKAEFSKDNRETIFCDIDIIKNWLNSNGYAINDNNNDFHKVISYSNPDIRFEQGGGVLLAPNGQPSNLTPEQHKLVRTPEFKAWFGDWENDPANASKVVDENGEPMVVYRGNLINQEELGYTFNLGQNFLKKKSDNQFGFFFTNEIDIAKKYMLVDHFDEIRGGSITNVFIKSTKTLDLKDFGLKISQDNFVKGLIEKGVSFDNEYNYLRKKILDFDYDTYKYWGYNVFDYFDAFPELRNLFLDNGFNSVIFYELSRSYSKYKVYVAFHSTQMKLADGTNTTFDSSNPDIRYEDGGELEKGIATEREHIKTLQDLFKHKITTKEAIMRTAKDHLAENPKYYTELEKIETMAQGGNADGFKYPTPFGKPSKLTFAQQSLVRTQAFKDWFGDWETAGKDYIKNAKPEYNVLTYEAYKNVSKVIDLETGEPRVMFHGTKAEKEFFVFNTNIDGTRRPYGYFAFNKEYSENFFSDGEGHLYNCFLNIKNPFNANGINFKAVRRDGAYWITTIAMKIVVQEKGNNLTEDEVQQAYLEIIGDMTFNSKVAQYLAQAYEGSKSFVPFWYAMSRDGAGIFKDFLKSRGFDGIFYSEEFSSTYDMDNPAEFTDAYTIFDPKQVKLADGRNTDFDQNKADIRYKKGGKVDMHHEHKNTSNMNRKERLASIIFANKFEEGGNVNEVKYEPTIAELNTPPRAKTQQELDKEFVNNLIKKMNK